MTKALGEPRSPAHLRENSSSCARGDETGWERDAGADMAEVCNITTSPEKINEGVTTRRLLLCKN